MAEMVRLSAVSRTLTDQVARELRRQIMLGGFQPGEQLGEMKLAAQLQVSRGTVREALSLLKREGLLEVAPHRTHRVARFDASDGREICDVLALLEAHGARQLTLPLAGPIVEQLSGVIDRMRRLRFPTDIDEFTKLDRAFHGLLLRTAGQHRLTQVWENLGPLLGVLMATTIPGLATTGPRIAARHQVLLQVAASGDVTALTEAIAEHYRFAEHNDDAAYRKSPGLLIE